jgi:hypothetical protein
MFARTNFTHAARRERNPTMTDIGPTGGTSGGDIIAWLEAKSLDQYGQLHDQIHESDDRTALAQKLSAAKSCVDSNKPNDAFTTLGEALPYCDDPKDTKDVLTQQIALIGWVTGGDDDTHTIDAEIEGSSLSDADKQDLHSKVSDVRTKIEANDTNSDTAENQAAHDKAQKGISEALEGKIQELSNKDSLALINIQQAVSDAKQTQELASNILSTRDQASLAVVGNIRG